MAATATWFKFIVTQPATVPVTLVVDGRGLVEGGCSFDVSSIVSQASD